MSNRYPLPLSLRDKAPKSVRRAGDVAIVFGQALPLTPLHPSLVGRVNIRRNVGKNVDPDTSYKIINVLNSSIIEHGS